MRPDGLELHFIVMSVNTHPQEHDGNMSQMSGHARLSLTDARECLRKLRCLLVDPKGTQWLHANCRKKLFMVWICSHTQMGQA